MTAPAVLEKGVCSRCKKTVWLRRSGYHQEPEGKEWSYVWMSRRGSKEPRRCPVSDGWPFTHHEVEGKPRRVTRIEP